MKRKSRSQGKNDDDWDEDLWEVIYELKRPSEIVIADDTNAYQAFGDSLFAAPQEDVLEGIRVPHPQFLTKRVLQLSTPR